jgi:uncharacterized MAPEG superfamily protein
MTIAYYCLLIAGLLPYIAVGFAKSGGGYDNARPRESMAKFKGRQARAVAAHANSFEAFPLFAAVVLLAGLTHADPHWVNTLSVIFIVARIGYIIAYLTDRPLLRSIVWMVGIACVLAIGSLSLTS